MMDMRFYRNVWAWSMSLAVAAVALSSFAGPTAFAKTVEFHFALPAASGPPLDWSRLRGEIRLNPSGGSEYRGPWVQTVRAIDANHAFSYSMPVPGTAEVLVAPVPEFPFKGRALAEVSQEQFASPEIIKVQVALSVSQESDLVVRFVAPTTNSPVTGQRIELSTQDTGRMLAVTTTDSQGIVRFKAVMDGAVQLVLVPYTGPNSIRLITAEEKANGNALWRVEPARIVLQGELALVKPDGTREPWPEDVQPPLLLKDEGGRLLTVSTGPHAKFYAYSTALPAGSYQWIVGGDGAARFELVEPPGVVIPPSGQPVLQTVLLRRRATGTLTLSLPRPPAGGRPWSVLVSGQGFQRTAESDLQGKVSFVDVPGGEISITAKSPNFQEITDKKMQVTETKRQFALEAVPCLTYVVTVRRESQPVKDASVTLRGIQGDAIKLYRGDSTQTAGQYLVGNLLAGRYSLSIRAPQIGIFYAGIVDLKENGSQVVDIPLGVLCHGQIIGIDKLPKPGEGTPEGLWPPQVALLLETPGGLTEGLGAGNQKSGDGKWNFTLISGTYRVFLLAHQNGYLLGRLMVESRTEGIEKDFIVTPEVLSHPLALEEVDRLSKTPRKPQAAPDKK
jgi:hypothetical protein